MSTPAPPAAVLAYATAYRCTDCHSEADTIRRDRRGIWHIVIEHDDGCPVLAGTVSHSDAGLAAAARAAVATGDRVAYVGV